MLTPLLLIAALAIVQVAQQGHLVIPPQPIWLSVVGALMLIAMTDFCARKLARHHGHTQIARLDQAVQILALGIFSHWALSSTWVHNQTWTTFCLIPLLITQIFLWISLARCVGTKTLSQRWSFASLRIRFELLPIFLLVIGLDIANITLKAFTNIPLLSSELMSIALALILLSILPLLLVKLWACRPIIDPQLKEIVDSACAESQLHVSKTYTWPQRPFPFYNAMAMGLLPGMRIVVISEDLLHALSNDECKAVIGHELGHLRHKHLVIYLLLLFSLSIWSYVFVSWLSFLWHPLVDSASVLGISMLLQISIVILGIRYIFGIVSRACERQADLHGARIAGFEPMQSALRKVAELVGQDLDTPNWRHHSIAERITFLKQHAQNPHVHQEHQLHIMRLSTLIIIALLTALTISIWQHSQGMDLEQVRKEDHELNHALDRALNFESDEELYAWLTQKPEMERQHFYKAALFKALGDDSGELSDTEHSKRVYNHRFLFTPFLRIRTGNDNMDVGIDNDVAYALVIGAQSVEEKQSAQIILRDICPRLEEVVKDSPSAQLEDTIACIKYTLGDYKQALAYFKKAQSHLDNLRGFDDDEKTQFEALLKQRVEAATTAMTAITEQKPVPTLPTE